MSEYKLVPVKLTPHTGHAMDAVEDDGGSIQEIWEAGVNAAPAVQGDSVPGWRYEALIVHAKQQDRIIAEMRERLHTVSLYEQKEVWFWQGDGDDYPESLSCPVVIKADDLREILQATPQPAEQQSGTNSDKYRAELYDEMWNKAKDMGYGNVINALIELGRLKQQPAPDVDGVLERIDRELRPRSMCRDCADGDGRCDSGELCDPHQRADELMGLLRASLAAPDVAGLVEALGSMTCAYRMAIQAGHARITALGGDCDSVDRMLADFPEYGKAVELFRAYRKQGGEA